MKKYNIILMLFIGSICSKTVYELYLYITDCKFTVAFLGGAISIGVLIMLSNLFVKIKLYKTTIKENEIVMLNLKEKKTVNMIFDDISVRNKWANKYKENGYMVTTWITYDKNYPYNGERFCFTATYITN